MALRKRIQNLRFNPLLIGAWVRTSRIGAHGHLEPLTFQSPLNRGLGSDVSEGGDKQSQCGSFNPLFIGAWVRTEEVEGLKVYYLYKFQSPLHRGLGSDFRKRIQGIFCFLVSIPSSSGPGFGPDDRPRNRKRQIVSIPSSSGPGFGHST